MRSYTVRDHFQVNPPLVASFPEKRYSDPIISYLMNPTFRRILSLTALWMRLKIALITLSEESRAVSSLSIAWSCIEPIQSSWGSVTSSKWPLGTEWPFQMACGRFTREWRSCNSVVNLVSLVIEKLKNHFGWHYSARESHLKRRRYRR